LSGNQPHWFCGPDFFYGIFAKFLKFVVIFVQAPFKPMSIPQAPHCIMPRASAIASLAIFSSFAVPAAARLAGVSAQGTRNWLAFAGTSSSAGTGRQNCVPLPAAQPAPNSDMTPVALKPVVRVQSDSSGCFSWIPLQSVAAKKHPHPHAQPAANDMTPVALKPVARVQSDSTGCISWTPLRMHEE
jgi:hypothetical protein